jgi:hypothetical protein
MSASQLHNCCLVHYYYYSYMADSYTNLIIIRKERYHHA